MYSEPKNVPTPLKLTMHVHCVSWPLNYYCKIKDNTLNVIITYEETANPTFPERLDLEIQGFRTFMSDPIGHVQTSDTCSAINQHCRTFIQAAIKYYSPFFPHSSLLM